MSGFDQEAEFSLEDGVVFLVRLSAPAVDQGVTKTALFPKQSSRPRSISPEQIDCLQEIKSRVGVTMLPDKEGHPLPLHCCEREISCVVTGCPSLSRKNLGGV